MDESIRNRLLFIEGQLLDALVLDTTAIQAFETNWLSLKVDIDKSVQERRICEDTMAIVHTVASRVAVLTEGFLGLHEESSGMTSALKHDLEHIFGRIDVKDDTASAVSENQPNAEPTFIASAYYWLLKNLHEPYPTLQIKEEIANSSGCSLNSINAWFINVRRRMGWTALCREHFHNCRAEAVDAAYRAFVQEDPKRGLDPQLAHAFMVLKVTAEGLYSSKFRKSALAGQLDVVVKDMTDEDRLKYEQTKKQRAEEDKKRKVFAKEQRRQERARERQAARSPLKSYPSPVRSPYDSPVPALEDSFTDESDNEEDRTAPHEQWLGHKRRASPSFASTGLAPSREERPLKRHRIVPKIPGILASPSVSALPSPPSEVDLDVFDYWSSQVAERPVTLDASSSPAPPVQSHNRKRRLSDGAVQGAPKRPRGVVRPRLQAVSDPLPKTNELADDFNTWLMSNFEIPPAVADEVPDPSTLLDVEVECYNWSSMQDCYKLPVDDTTMLSSPPYSTQPCNSFNMDPNPFFITEINPLSTGDNLDELYHNIFGTNSHHPPPYSSQPVDGAASSLTCVSSDSGITSAAPLSFSDDLFSDSGAWSHLPSYADALSSFNPSSTYLSIPVSSDSSNLSSILSEIDLSMLQLPTSSPHIPRPNEETTRFADKQAKLEQLKMLEEAKRRLEAELASEA